MIRRSYLVSEGPQDVEFLIQILKHYGLRRVTRLSSLDPFWEPLVPKTFPIDDDLVKRVPVPTFLHNAEFSVALHSAVGLTRLVNTIEESLAVIPISDLFGIGLVLDADTDETPRERFHSLSARLTSLGLAVPSVPGEVLKNSPRCGVFILPNNSASGTLEDVLIECAQVNYSDLLNLATTYLTSIDESQLTHSDLRELTKPTGKNKAVVSSISSVLKPGKSLQVSIQDNRWLDDQTLKISSVNSIKTFLAEVIGAV